MDRKQIKFHIIYQLKNPLYYIMILILYFIPSFRDAKTVFLSNYDDFVYRMTALQLFACFGMIIQVSLFFNEEYILLYQKYFCIMIGNQKAFFINFFIVLILSNIVPFILFSSLSIIFNHLVAGFRFSTTIPFVLFIMTLQIILTLILAITLFMLFKKNSFTYLLYLVMISLLGLSDNVYLSLPLTARITTTYGHFYRVSSDLLYSRIFILLVLLIIFLFSLNRFTVKQLD